MQVRILLLLQNSQIMTDTELIEYNQRILDIEWLLKVRAASGSVKLNLFINANPFNAQRVCHQFWSFNEAELREIKRTINMQIEDLLTEVDINQIL